VTVVTLAKRRSARVGGGRRRESRWRCPRFGRRRQEAVCRATPTRRTTKVRSAGLVLFAVPYYFIPSPPRNRRPRLDGSHISARRPSVRPPSRTVRVMPVASAVGRPHARRPAAVPAWPET